MERNNI